MNNLIDTREPIGAVVKRADNVNTNLLRRTSEHGTFNRIEWQFLNFIKKENTVSTERIFEFLDFFGNGPIIQDLIFRFKWDGLITIEKDIVSITPRGEKAYEKVFEIQEEIKEKAMEGIAVQDYNTTIETLYRIMDNVKEYLPQDEEMALSKNDDKVIYSQNPAFEHVDDLQSIRELITEIEKTYNQKDPYAFAALFDVDAVFVNAMGIRLRGKETIYNLAKKMMESTLNKSYAKYEISGIRFIKQDVAIVEVNQKPINSHGELLEDEAEGIPTYVLNKDAKTNQWRILAGQNTIVYRDNNDKK